MQYIRIFSCFFGSSDVKGLTERNAPLIYDCDTNVCQRESPKIFSKLSDGHPTK